MSPASKCIEGTFEWKEATEKPKLSNLSAYTIQRSGFNSSIYLDDWVITSEIAKEWFLGSCSRLIFFPIVKLFFLISSITVLSYLLRIPPLTTNSRLKSLSEFILLKRQSNNNYWRCRPFRWDPLWNSTWSWRRIYFIRYKQAKIIWNRIKSKEQIWR